VRDFADAFYKLQILVEVLALKARRLATVIVGIQSSKLLIWP
jgi:hypothetical protein